MTNPNDVPQSATTAAFQLQAILAFVVSLAAAVTGVWNLPLDPWQRGFFAITVLFLVSSTFTLTKVIRDRQDQHSVITRLDEARMEKLIAEHDPYKGVA
ncbi:MAG: YiaA/YiaB family inner membrane protein [Gordonia sp. (in: high G+C Gram-positive bacteria)]